MHGNYNSACCGSCSCNTGCDTSPCPTRCKGQVTEAELGTLVYLKGLDINLCPKYQAVANALGYKDCNGVAIVPGTQLVTCAGFQEQLCETFALLALGAPITTGTVLIGADCQRHAMPALQAPITVEDTDCIDLTLAGTVLTADPVISPSLGNLLECTPSGLFVDLDLADLCPVVATIPAGAAAVAGTPLLGVDCLTHALPAFQAPLTVEDTDCIDLTLVGSVLSAEPIISPAVGNQLSCTPTGLFVPAAVVPTDTVITATDTSCLDLTVVEAPANTFVISGSPIVSPDVGNQLVCSPNGLLVPAAALPTDVVITATDTSCLDLTVTESPANTFVITGSPVISPVVGNILECRVDGLAVTCANVLDCVPDVTILGTDTECISVVVNEAPAGSFSVSAEPIISPDLGNQLTCSPNGLFVPAAAPQVTCAAIQGVFTDNPGFLLPGTELLAEDCTTYPFPGFVGIDTPSIDTTVLIAGGNVSVQSNIIVAPTAAGYPVGCNGLVTSPTGLYAPPDSAGTAFEVSTGGNFIVGIPMVNGQVIASPLMTLNIVNPSACRSALLTIELNIPGSNSNFSSTGVVTNTSLEIVVNHSFNLPAILVTALNTFTRFNVNGNTTNLSGNPPSNRVFYFIVPPSFVGSYSTNATVTSIGGADFVTVGRIGAQYSIVTI